MKRNYNLRKSLHIEKEGLHITSWLVANQWDAADADADSYSFNIARNDKNDADGTIVFDSIDELTEAHHQLGLFLDELTGEEEPANTGDKGFSDKESRSYEELKVKGKKVDCSFSCEPGAPYGEEDAFFIEASVRGVVGGSIGFESFEQMEEFSRLLARYVECQKILRKSSAEDSGKIS